MVKVNGKQQFVILNPNSDDIKITKNYRNECIWHCVKKYDEDKDSVLNMKEIRNFNNAVYKAAGEDKKMTPEELKAWADKLGVSTDNLRKTIIYINANILGESIAKSLNPGSLEARNKDQAKDLIAKIDENSVSEVWDQYQFLADKKNRNFLTGKTKRTTSLSKVIFETYEFNEAKAMTDKILASFEKSAKKENIGIQTLVADYNNAAKNKDTTGMDKALHEIALRFNISKNQSYAIDQRIFTDRSNGIGVKITPATRMLMREYASAKNVEENDDLYGNGILGDSKSVPITPEGKIVMQAINQLLNNDKTKEMIQACIKKEKHCIAVYSQPRHEVFVVTEKSFISTDIIKDSVVGDGDMATFVTAVLTMAEKDKITFQNAFEAREYIEKCFTPNLYSK